MSVPCGTLSDNTTYAAHRATTKDCSAHLFSIPIMPHAGPLPDELILLLSEKGLRAQ